MNANVKEELFTINVNRAVSRPTVDESLTGGVHGTPVGAYERGGYMVPPQGLHAVVIGVPDVIPTPWEVLPPAHQLNGCMRLVRAGAFYYSTIKSRSMITSTIHNCNPTPFSAVRWN